LPPDYRPADPHELHEAPGAVTFASHTWSHPNLTRVSDEALRLELERSRNWIGETFGGRALTDHLTFPYGLWDERVVREATSVGYRWLYRVDGGLLRRGPAGVEPTPRPRINVPSGVSLRGFELRVSGLIG
jgi:peptidoglycan/xylan/chitin deacetylase (PgdA/CDA1 family)